MVAAPNIGKVQIEEAFGTKPQIKSLSSILDHGYLIFINIKYA